MSEPEKAGEQKRVRRLGILNALSDIIQRYENRESAAAVSRVDDFTLNRDARDTLRDRDHPLVSGVRNYYRAQRGGPSTRPPDHTQRSREIVQRYEDRQLEQLRLFPRR